MRAVIAGAVLASAPWASKADAGCGCDKPPPEPAQVRPSFASLGQTVTLFGPDIKGGKYQVTFEADGASATVTVQSENRRDLADGKKKHQLRVTMPSGLPLGPARIRVTRHGNGAEVLRIPSDQFTVLQAPLRLEESDGVTIAKCYRAAVGEDGTVYFPFEIGAISRRMVFSGLAESYPLTFTPADVAIYNTQGFLMQLLEPEQAGELYTIEDPGSPKSFELIYERHEFVTYKRQHQHEGRLALDKKDPDWHVDGTPHVDHDNLVIAIAGRLEDGSTPQPGSTPAFDLSVATALADTSTRPTTRVLQWSSSCGPDRARR
ncbi:MAG TPA: hypothetical protein VIS07_05125 [Candidatus Binatia bacterium]